MLNALKDVDVGEVNISFRGRCLSWYTGSDDKTYKLECYFFHYTQVLYTGRYTIGKSNSPSWPFSFRFPDVAQPSPNPSWIVAKNGESRRGWTFRPGSPLPPSFFSCGSKVGCHVVYELDAKLKKPTNSFHLITQKFRHTLPLTFVPPRSEENVPLLPRPFNRQWDVSSHRLVPENRDRHLTFSEKISFAFSSDTPVSRFHLSATIPSQIVQGSLLPITLHTTWDGAGSSIDTVPPMHIQEVRVTAVQITAVRSSGSEKDRTQKFDLCSAKGLNMEINPSISGGSGKNSEDPEPVAPMQLGHLLKIKTGRLTPDFLSYGCRLRYNLTLKIKLQCVDQKYELRPNWMPFTVVSPYYPQLNLLEQPLEETPPSFDASPQPRPTCSPPPYQPSAAERLPSYTRKEAGSSAKPEP